MVEAPVLQLSACCLCTGPASPQSGDWSSLGTAHSSQAQKQWGPPKSSWATCPNVGACPRQSLPASLLLCSGNRTQGWGADLESHPVTQQAPSTPIPWPVRYGRPCSLRPLTTPREECHLAASCWQMGAGSLALGSSPDRQESRAAAPSEGGSGVGKVSLSGC